MITFPPDQFVDHDIICMGLVRVLRGPHNRNVYSDHLITWFQLSFIVLQSYFTYS